MLQNSITQRYIKSSSFTNMKIFSECFCNIPSIDKFRAESHRASCGFSAQNLENQNPSNYLFIWLHSQKGGY
jgi:hypothetical protein